ncbi:hypothetical protein BH20ACT2_BH20ACT2_12690 [soil metagenome]
MVTEDPVTEQVWELARSLLVAAVVLDGLAVIGLTAVVLPVGLDASGVGGPGVLAGCMLAALALGLVPAVWGTRRMARAAWGEWGPILATGATLASLNLVVSVGFAVSLGAAA